MSKTITKDSTSNLERVFISDTSKTDGSGLTGLTYDAANLQLSSYREDDGVVTHLLAPMALGTWASAGFVEVDAVNLPGVYEIGLPNVVCESGSDSLELMLSGAANMAQTPARFELVDAVVVPTFKDQIVLLEDAVITLQLSIPGTYSFRLDSGSPDDDAYTKCVAIFRSGSQVAVATISNYLASQNEITVTDNLPFIPDAGDLVTIVADIATVRRTNANEPNGILFDDYTGNGSVIARDPNSYMLFGSVGTATSTTVQLLADNIYGPDDYYNGAVIYFPPATGGAFGYSQSRVIVDWDATGQIATVDRAFGAGDEPSGCNFVIVHGENKTGTGGGGDASTPDVLIETTIAAVTDAAITLAQGAPDDDAYAFGSLCIIEANANADKKWVGVINDYDATNKIITLDDAPAFAAIGDKVAIMADRSIKAINPDNYRIDLNVAGWVKADVVAWSVDGVILPPIPGDTDCDEAMTLSAIRGDYWTLTIQGMGDVSDRTKLLFGIKSSQDINDDNDADCLVQIEETDGLLYIQKQGVTTPNTLGKITVTDPAAGDFIINLSGHESSKLVAEESMYWEIQKHIDVSGVDEPVTLKRKFPFVLVSDVNRTA